MPNLAFSCQRVLRIWLLCGMVFSLAWAQEGPGRMAYLTGESHRKQNQYDKAIEQYQEAIALEPGNYAYHFQQGKCAYKLNRTEKAKAAFMRTVELKPGFTPAYSLLAKLFRDEQAYGQAIGYYQLAAESETHTGRKLQYHLLAANLLLKEDRQAEAKTQVSQARRIDPSNPHVLYYMAEVAAAAEDWEESRRIYEESLSSDRLRPASDEEKAKYFYGLGIARYELGDAAGAKNAWARANHGPYRRLVAQRLSENNPVQFYKIAVSYYLNDEWEASEQYADQALEMNPNFPSGLILKAKLALQRDQPRDAAAYLRQAIKAEKEAPDQLKLYRMLAELQLENGDPSGALLTVGEAEGKFPQGDQAMIATQAKAQYQLQRYRDAVITLDRLLATELPTKAQAKYNFLLGMAAKRVPDTERAREAFKKALFGPYKPAAEKELEQL